MERPSRRSFVTGFTAIGTAAGAAVLISNDSKAQSASNLPFVNVKDFGAVGNWNETTQTGTDDTAAIIAANNAATSGSQVRKVVFPNGTYKYKPNSVLFVRGSWEGETPGAVISCDTSAYSGEFFRVTKSGSISSLTIKTMGLTERGTGIRVAPEIDPADVTGYVKLSRLFVQGFDKNIHVESVVMLSLDCVQSTAGREGFYCSPTIGPPQSGYVTTHLHINCSYMQNDRNVFYQSPIASVDVSFINSSIELATGPTAQSYFNNIRLLKFTNCYFEARPNRYALHLANCTTIIDSTYFNDTGGIYCGTDPNSLTIRNGYIAPPAPPTIHGTDKLVMQGGSVQKLFVEYTQFPTAGNIVDVGQKHLKYCRINETTFQDYRYSMPLQVDDGAGYNGVYGIDSFTVSIPATTIPANSSTPLVYNGYRVNVFNNAAGFANLTIPVGGISLQVGPADTGSPHYYTVHAINGTNSQVVIPAQTLRVVIMRFAT